MAKWRLKRDKPRNYLVLGSLAGILFMESELTLKAGYMTAMDVSPVRVSEDESD